MRVPYLTELLVHGLADGKSVPLELMVQAANQSAVPNVV